MVSPKILNILQEIQTEVFEYDKKNFKSERLRRLCTFRGIILPEEDPDENPSSQPDVKDPDN